VGRVVVAGIEMSFVGGRTFYDIHVCFWRQPCFQRHGMGWRIIGGMCLVLRDDITALLFCSEYASRSIWFGAVFDGDTGDEGLVCMRGIRYPRYQCILYNYIYYHAV
jgi:hypothetical protein